jgi:hypothetical protein
MRIVQAKLIREDGSIGKNQYYYSDKYPARHRSHGWANLAVITALNVGLVKSTLPLKVAPESI